jgi:uncharacterized protein YmfQ (DUF2313 family)
MPTTEQVSLQLVKLAPPGALRRVLGSGLRNLWMGLADELVRVYGRVQDMIREAHPLTCNETLADWENEYGLPDPCVTATQTIDERKSAVAARLGSVGGQSRAYFIAVAAGMGFSISITEEKPFLIGLSGMGDGIGGDNFAFTWTTTASASLTTAQRQLLECTFQRLKPAHTTVQFQYV